MRNLKQILIKDYGARGMEVSFVMSKNPLVGEKFPPTLFMTWKKGNTDYFCAYWHVRNTERLTVSEIARIAEKEIVGMW